MGVDSDMFRPEFALKVRFDWFLGEELEANRVVRQWSWLLGDELAGSNALEEMLYAIEPSDG